MRTHCLIYLTLILCSLLSAEQPAQHQSKIVSIDFGVQNGPDGLGRLSVTDQAAGIIVQVPTPAHAEVAKLGLQVWLLKADGTVVAQRRADREAGMIGSGLGQSWFVLFDFPKVPLAEIVGIVFRKQGRLYSREIPVDAWKPWN